MRFLPDSLKSEPMLKYAQSYSFPEAPHPQNIRAASSPLRGSRFFLKSLAKVHVMCFAATHDIELTHLLEEFYSNYHFQEEVKENDILFNYMLYRGRAVSRNAIKLLGIIGYDGEIIKEAEKTAENFVNTGIWSL